MNEEEKDEWASLMKSKLEQEEQEMKYREYVQTYCPLTKDEEEWPIDKVLTCLGFRLNYIVEHCALMASEDDQAEYDMLRAIGRQLLKIKG